MKNLTWGGEVRGGGGRGVSLLYVRGLTIFIQTGKEHPFHLLCKALEFLRCQI